MAATVANSTYGNSAFGSSSLTISGYSHGGGPLSVISVIRSPSGSITVTGITANGTGMSLLGSQTTENAVRTDVYTLNDIASFTGDIVISYSDDVYYGGAHVLSFSGATATPFSGFASASNSSGSSTAPSVTISSASGDLVVACLANADTGTTHTIGSGQTLVRDDAGTNGTDPEIKQRLVTTTEGGAASVVMDGTLSAGEYWSAVGFSVAAAVDDFLPTFGRYRQRQLLTLSRR